MDKQILAMNHEKMLFNEAQLEFYKKREKALDNLRRMGVRIEEI